ncbi:MAG: hypothetical protein HOI95_24605 [Chromatiales bacterium]|nr:hypothetical protein [Chromatiales bacterium]
MLSHTDLLSDEGAAVSAWLVEVHGGSSVSSLVRDPLGGLDHTSEADLSGPKIEPDLHDQHHAFVWETSHLVDAVALEQVLDQLPSSVARAKGFIAVPSSGPPLVLQSTGDRWALCPMEDVTGMAASVQRAAGGQLTFVISPCSHPMAVEQQVRELLSGIERP